MIIISLTTTSKRLNLLRISLQSLITQSTQPDKIIVWVSKESYLSDDGIENLDRLVNYFGDVINNSPTQVEFRYTSNTGPYRKLLPILASCEDDDLVIPVDDDIYYGQNWLEKLLTKHLSHPDKAVAARVREIKKNLFGRVKGYIYWPLIRTEGEYNKDILVTFGGGVILKRSFFSSSLLKSSKYLELAPTADDIWFSALLKNSGTSVYVVPSALVDLYFIEHPLGLYNNFNVKNPKSGALLLLIQKVWRKFAGFLGIVYTGNDKAYRLVTNYFKKVR